MRRLLTALILSCAFLSSGCLVDTDGLQKTVAGLKELEAQVDDDAKDRIEQIVAGLQVLIKEAEKAGGRLEEKVVLDFIAQRRETIEAVLEAYDKVSERNLKLGQELLVPVQALPGDLQDVLKGFPEKLRDGLIDMAVVMNMEYSFGAFGSGKFGVVDNLVMPKELLVGMQAGTSYQVAFLAKNPSRLQLTLPDKTSFGPWYVKGACVIFKIPSSLLNQKFEDVDADGILNNKMKYVVEESAGGSAPPRERHRGEFVLLPKFHVKYNLTVTDRRGRQRAVHVDQGAGIIELAAATRAAIEESGGSTASVAEAHGRLYRIAESHLPYGYSEVVLEPDDVTWSLEIKVAGRRPDVLNQHHLDGKGVRVKTANERDHAGRECKKLMLYVDPIVPGA